VLPDALRRVALRTAPAEFRFGAMPPLARSQVPPASVASTPEFRQRVRAEAEALAQAEGIGGYVDVRKAFRDDVRATAEARHAAGLPPAPIAPEQQGSIHINFDLLAIPMCPLTFVALQIIHEASHKFCSTEDYAYTSRSAYARMSKAQALANADSYAYTAMSLYKRYFLPDEKSFLSRETAANIDLNS
jgi:hypothetical protein